MPIIPNLKLLIAFAVVSAWSVVATYQWFSNHRKAELECNTEQLDAEIAQLKATAKDTEQQLLDKAKELERLQTLQAQQTDLGNAAQAGNQATFTPIREVIREIRVDSCPGAFTERVQDGFRSAVEATNAAGKG